MPELPTTAVDGAPWWTDKLAGKAHKQFGSLGSGNHFIEICLDEADRVWIVLHSGSRGVGNQLANIHIDGAKALMQRYFIELPDPDLAYLVEGTPEFETALTEFDERMAHYLKHRLYPVLPDWPVICFYPMSKRRSGDDNWYSLSFEQRRQLMSGHARVGRTYSGRILQLITGSTGLDEYEWGVTLLAKDTIDIKAIVYEMRFDEVSARYADFGDFYIGMQLPLDVLFRRICL